MNGEEFMVTFKNAAEVIDDALFAKASARGGRLVSRGPLAIAAHYKAGRVHVELNNGCAFEFPTAQAEGLTGANIAALRKIEIQGNGLALYWPKLDADLYVPTLIKGMLGTTQWMAHIGATGGKTATTAKSAAARTNGKLGGRPKKTAAHTAV